MRLRIFIILTVVSVLFLCKKNEDTSKEKVLLSRFDIFQGKLKMKLQEAIKSKGFAGAVEVCNEASPALEKEMSENTTFIKRISSKPRNQNHIPDEFEAGVFAIWEKEMAEGKKPGVVSKMTEEGFRTMKPILLQDGVCLKCHGDSASIDKKAAEKINKLYPLDKATGYKAGDLRGAFSGIIK